MLYNKFTIKRPVSLSFLAILLFIYGHDVSAQNASTTSLQAQIDQITAQKTELEAEIATYENQLKGIGTQANTLSAAIGSLDVNIKKNTLDIKLTENNIAATGLQIQELGSNIASDTDIISEDNIVIANLISETNKYDSANIIENLLAYNNISDFWNEMESIYKVQNQLGVAIADMKNTKTRLENIKQATEQKKRQLIALKSNLEDQKQVLGISKQEKTKLLSETKDEESNYESILAQKKAMADAFDQELANFESGLKFVINPNSYPLPQPGILSWPLNIIIKITQFFGMTEFAKTTTAYNGQGHNGVDLGAPIGTPVYAALDGIVEGTGDTDLACPGASFGKWVFIKHENGLSTMYAHLSIIKASEDEFVRKGDIIGYTGITGFTTGPHLHFGLYVTEGSRIMQVKSKVCDGAYTMPVADLAAYLDPLGYLPNL